MATAELTGVHLIREDTAPSLKLTFKDLMDVCLIIRGGIHSILETDRPGQARHKKLQTLIKLYTRLMSVPPGVTGIALLLSQEEITLLDAAVASFCAYMHDNVPLSSPGREEMLREFKQIHEALHML